MIIRVVLFTTLLFIGCASNDDNNLIHVKPKNVPDSSFWAGGVDGGNWYFVESIHDHRNSARIAVYNDQDGSLIIESKFILMCRMSRKYKYTLIDDLKKQISFFDGEKIYFSQSDSVNCYLLPVK